MNNEPITVVTLTRRRPKMLARAIASVQAQNYLGPIEHLIVIDDDPGTLFRLRKRSAVNGRILRWHLQKRPEAESDPHVNERRSIYPRLARLLNLGVAKASFGWMAFLDDDNEFEPNHLSSLMQCVHEHHCQAVHSARHIVWADGAPYLESHFPGASNAEEGARIYELMCARGVWLRGTNILQDRVDDVQRLSFNNSTVMSNEDPVFLVDQNLWLIKRSLLQRLPIPEVFTDEDIAANVCPDDKLLEVLVRNHVKIVSSQRPTVRYYLGGISNGNGLVLKTTRRTRHILLK